MAVIFILELGAGVSIFAYRSKLADGFNQGLNESMINYQNGPKEKTAAFDLMQTTVSKLKQYFETSVWKKNIY